MKHLDPPFPEDPRLRVKMHLCGHQEKPEEVSTVPEPLGPLLNEAALNVFLLAISMEKAEGSDLLHLKTA